MADKREFLERSLADLDAEHDAGDLSDADHAELRAEYERRLAALDAPKRPAPRRPPASKGSRGGRLASIAFVIVVAIGAGVLLAGAVGRRGAGDNVSGADLTPDGTGGVTVATATTLPTELQRCFDLDGGDAFDCYIAYTRAQPDDARGFLYFGLFSVNQGLQADSQELIDGGETFLRRALELDPGMLEARANLGVLLERTGRDDEAAEVIAPLLDMDLPADVAQLVDFVERNLAEAAASTTVVP